MRKQETIFVADYFARRKSASIFVILLFSFCLTNKLKATLFWDITVVDPSGSGKTSMVVLPSGLPAISYGVWGLKYAWFDGAEWHTNCVEQDTHAGSNSMIILPTGQPAISYVDYTNKLLKYAVFNGTNWQITEVGAVGSLGILCSTNLVTLSSGEPVISYFTGSPDLDLKFAWLDDNVWYNTVIDNAVGFTFSMSRLPSDQPAIAYRKNSRLMYAWHEGNDFTTNWNIVEIPDSGDGSGYDASLAILPTGHPAISHTARGGGNPWLNYTWFDGTAWQTTGIDLGDQSSLVISPAGEPAISYQGYPYHRDRFEYNEPDSCLVLVYPERGIPYSSTVVDTMGGWIGDSSSLVFLPSGKPAISYYGDGVRYATPSDIPDAPVSMTANCTATAWTELWSDFDWGLNTDTSAGTGYVGASSGDAGWTSYDSMDPYIEPGVIAYTSFWCWTTSQLRGLINLDGSDGEECVAWDDWELDCTESAPVSCGDASGKVDGTIDIGTSEEFPTGTELGLSLEVRNLGYSSDGGEYYFKLWRGGSLMAQIDSSAPDPDCVNVMTGDRLSFEFFAAEKDDHGDEVNYHRGLEFRGILRQTCSIGTINVITDLNEAHFTLYGPSIVLSGHGLNWQKTGVPTGDYKVVFEDMPGYITPTDQTGMLEPDGTLTFTASYTQADGIPMNIPTLVLPTDGDAVLTTPTFQLFSSAAEDIQLQFKIEILKNEVVVKTFDQTQDTTNWNKADYTNNEVATFNIPKDQALTPGVYQWCAYAFDSQNWSIASQTYTFSVTKEPYIDLIVEGISIITTFPDTTKNVEIGITVRNLGSQDLNQPFTILLTTNGPLSVGQYSDTITIDSISANGLEEIEAEWVWVKPGTQIIYAYVDSGMKITESDETNNSTEQYFYVEGIKDDLKYFHTPTSGLALIIKPFKFQNYVEYSDQLESELLDKGYLPPVVLENSDRGVNDEANIPNLISALESSQYGIIHFTTHGTDAGVLIETFETNDEMSDRWNSLKENYYGNDGDKINQELFNNTDEIDRKPAIGIKGDFIRHHLTYQNSNPIVYFESCLMGSNLDMKDAFIYKGAGCYIGFDKEVAIITDLNPFSRIKFREAKEVSEEFYKSVFNSENVRVAVELREPADRKDENEQVVRDSKLTYFGNDYLYFRLP